jgi:dipeptidase E
MMIAIPEVRRLLLISTSTVHGTGYLDHAEEEIRDHLAMVRRVLFVPYALHDRDAYAAKARTRFEAMGLDLDSIHEAEDPLKAVDHAEAIFIGGGNTFRLLKALYEFDLIEAIRERVDEGMPYMGASAGSNVACPTIMTTNDMPIVQPPSLKALNLIPFQINPHYIDPDPNSTHMGETREERLMQYLEENNVIVIGLREGAMLRVGQGTAQLKGLRGARIFSQGQPPYDIAPATALQV